MKSLSYLVSFSVLTAALAGCESKITPDTSGSETAPAAQTVLTPEALHASPSINGPVLKKPAVSPDGKVVTVLQGRENDASQQDLWAYDLETGEGQILVSSTDLLGAPEVLSEEEKNRRERAREYGQGIVSYGWANEDLLLFPLGGDVYLYNLAETSAQQVTATKDFETDPQVAPGGEHVAYVRGNELYVTTLATGLERQLTDGATDLIRNATASFVVQEELKRSTGYWWSPDASRIAYTQIDDSPLATENRIDFGADGIRNISQRYPFAGTDNSTVKLGIVSRDGGETVWADIGDNPDIYLTRVLWAADGETLYVGILSRDHKTHTVLKVDPAMGNSENFFTETSPTWLNIGKDLEALETGSVLWSSEKDGYRRVFRYDAAGEASAVTPEGVHVNSLKCVDEDGGRIYFEGWDETPLERHVFKAGFDGTGFEKISAGEGDHRAIFASNCETYISTFSNPDTPPQTRAFQNDGTPLAWLNENALDEDHPYARFVDVHIEPEYGQIKAADGTPLDYILFKPHDLKDSDRRPAITLVYGGPGVQRVNKSWGRKHFARMLAQNGFVVFMLDNRGATNRGKAFEDPLYRAMGQTEVADQTIGAQWLGALPFVDKNRMGVYGWSYGGYMSLHMLAQTDLYKSGVAGAPVTDWALYDTAYTERYLGHPNEDDPNYAEGAYENGSVFAHIDGLTEPFLLIHGMADDNVVFRHSVKLMDAMQKSGRQNMRVMTYPGEKHGFRSTQNRIHRDRMILDYFQETLGE